MSTARRSVDGKGSEHAASESAVSENHALGKTMKKTIFTVLLVVIKEDQKPRHWFWLFATLVIDFFQLLSFPLAGGTAVPFGLVEAFSGVAEKFRLYSELAGSLGGFMAALYVSWAWVFSVLVTFYYVYRSCSRGTVKYIAPFRYLRFSIGLSLAVLFIPVAQVMLFTLDCNYFSDPYQHYWISNFKCWDTSHTIHSIVSLLLLAAYSALLALMTLVYFDYKPGRLTAKAHGRLDFLYLACRLALCLNVTFFHSGGSLALLSSIFLVLISLSLCVGTLYFLPFYEKTLNCAKAGTYFSFFWASLITFISLSSGNRIDPTVLSVLIFVGVPLSFAGGYFTVHILSKTIWKNCLEGIFWTKYHLEVASRFFYLYHHEINTAQNQAILQTLSAPPSPTLHPESGPPIAPIMGSGGSGGGVYEIVHSRANSLDGSSHVHSQAHSLDCSSQPCNGSLAMGLTRTTSIRDKYLQRKSKKLEKLTSAIQFGQETLKDILECGKIAFPGDSFLTICQALHAEISFQDPVSSIRLFSGVVNAKTAHFDLEFLAYRCVEERKRGGGSVGAAAAAQTDVISQFELARDMRVLKRSHLRALHALLQFWEALSQSEITLQSMESVLDNLQQWEKGADQSFKSILRRAPGNPRLLRSYASFLLDVKNDVGKAMQVFQEADDAEEVAGKASTLEALQILPPSITMKKSASGTMTPLSESVMPSQPSYDSLSQIVLESSLDPQQAGAVGDQIPMIEYDLHPLALPTDSDAFHQQNFSQSDVHYYSADHYHSQNVGLAQQYPFGPDHESGNFENYHLSQDAPDQNKSVSFALPNSNGQIILHRSPSLTLQNPPVATAAVENVPPAQMKKKTKRKSRSSENLQDLDMSLVVRTLSPQALAQHKSSLPLTPTSTWVQQQSHTFPNQSQQSKIELLSTSSDPQNHFGHIVLPSMPLPPIPGGGRGEDQQQSQQQIESLESTQQAWQFSSGDLGGTPTPSVKFAPPNGDQDMRSRSSGDTSGSSRTLGTSISKLRQVLESGKIANQNLSRLLLAMRVILLIIFAMNVLIVSTILADFSMLQEYFTKWLFEESLRSGLTTLIWLSTKTITIMYAFLTVGSAVLPKHTDLHANILKARSNILESAEKLRTLHLDSWNYVKTKPGPHRDLFTQKSLTAVTSAIPPQTFNATQVLFDEWNYRDAPTESYPVSLLDLGNEYVMKATASVVLNDTSTVAYNSFFLRQNEQILRQGYIKSMSFFLDDAFAQAKQIQDMQGAFLGVALFIFLVMAVYLFYYNLPRIEKEKSSVLNLIVATPRSICRVMAQRMQNIIEQTEDSDEDAKLQADVSDPTVPFSETDFKTHFPAAQRTLDAKRSKGQLRMIYKLVGLLFLLFSCFVVYCSVSFVASNEASVAAIDLNWPMRSEIIRAWAQIQEIGVCVGPEWCTWAHQSMKSMKQELGSLLEDFVHGHGPYRGILGRFSDVDSFLTTCTRSNCTIPGFPDPMDGYLQIAKVFGEQISLLLAEDVYQITLDFSQIQYLSQLYPLFLDETGHLLSMIIDHINQSFTSYILGFALTLASSVLLLLWVYVIIRKQVVEKVGGELCRIDLCLMLLPQEVIELMPDLKSYLVKRTKLLETGNA